METIIAYGLLLVIFSLGYLRGYMSKQERKWLDGYREGLKDAGFDIKAIIKKYDKE